MRARLRRAGAFALVPLSALPLVAVAPLVAPSFAHRFEQLTGGSNAPVARTAPPLPPISTTTERTR